jgi:hypothetical protein
MANHPLPRENMSVEKFALVYHDLNVFRCDRFGCGRTAKSTAISQQVSLVASSQQPRANLATNSQQPATSSQLESRLHPFCAPGLA